MNRVALTCSTGDGKLRTEWVHSEKGCTMKLGTYSSCASTQNAQDILGAIRKKQVIAQTRDGSTSK